MSTEDDVIDSTFLSGVPLTVKLGSGELHPIIEGQILSRFESERVFEILLDPSLAFGEHDTSLLIEVPLSRLPEQIVKNLSDECFFDAPDAKGQSRRWRFKGKKGPLYVFDANHPLAGQHIYLKVEVIDID